MSFHLAQINVARLIAPLEDPQIAEFVAALAPINELADRSEGFVWRLQGASGNATDLVYSANPFVIVNMSVWTTPGALRDFVYRSGHVDIYRKRRQWFEPSSAAPYCLWWMPAGQIPTVQEGSTRLEHYHRYGATEHAFWFSQLYPAPALMLA